MIFFLNSLKYFIRFLRIYIYFISVCLAQMYMWGVQVLSLQVDSRD